MTRTTKKAAAKLNTAIAGAVKRFAPPESLTVDEWADKHRRLSPESSAEAGPWRTKRTPYLEEPMRAFTDPKVHKIVMVAASQVGKSELELNIIGYIIDQDPGSILYVHPTIDDARKFSRLRVAPMIRDSKPLKVKVHDVKAKDSGNTILQKSFPGGMLTLTGSNSASALASTPARYIIGDERDRWAASAGTEGDPWALAEARQATFYNAKAVEVSTPTIKGNSNIETSFYQGTQERWCHRCPECGEYSEIVFDNIHFDPEVKRIRGKKSWSLKSGVSWSCPACGCLIPEDVMRKQPAKWIADNPDAYKKGVRSFWLNAFSSPWTPWEKIVLKFLDAKDDPQRLKVVYNTLLGQLWEDRGDLEDEDTMLSRREDYGTRPDGTPVELPDGVLVLTCGVDTQDNRLEYEVVGHGKYGETWGIVKGYIMGRPDTPEVWQQAQGLGSTLIEIFGGLKTPLSNAALAISQGMKGGLISAFPEILASLGGLIGSIGGAFVAMLDAIAAALFPTGFGTPQALLMIAAGVALAAVIAGIVASIGGSFSKKGSSGRGGSSGGSSGSGGMGSVDITTGTGSLEDAINANTKALEKTNSALADMIRQAGSLVLSDNMRLGSTVAASGTAQVVSAARSYHREGDTTINQYIQSKAQTAADLARETRWEADKAKARKR